MAATRDPAEELPLPPHDLDILIALSGGRAHGYGILRAIEEGDWGARRPSTSSLYAALKRMLARGLVEDAGPDPEEASGGPPRRAYRITPYGRRVARLETLRLQRTASAATVRFLADAPLDAGSE